VFGDPLLSLGLWSVPVVVHWWARRRRPPKCWRLTGLALGLVVAPASLGLYALYYLSPWTAPLGIVGLLLVGFHGWPGNDLAIKVGLVEARTVVQGVEHLYIALLNAPIWSILYGVVGWAIDAARSRRSARVAATEGRP